MVCLQALKKPTQTGYDACLPSMARVTDVRQGHMAGMEQMWSHVSWIGFYPNLGRWFKTLQRITATGMLTRSSPSQIFAARSPISIPNPSH